MTNFQMQPFNEVFTIDTTTGLAAVEVFGRGVKGWESSYTVRGTTGTDNTDLAVYFADRIADSGEDTTPAALPAADYRLIDDTGNVPTVSATEKFAGDALAYPHPFQGGLWCYVNATGGATGHYTVSVRGFKQ